MRAAPARRALHIGYWAADSVLVTLDVRPPRETEMPTTDPPTYPLSIPDLRAAITGRVIAPDDEGYDAARTVFVGGVDRRPLVIVQVANESDVQHVVRLARETGLPLAIRSGGHSNGGMGVVDDGIVLDLRDMRALDIDADAHTAWVQSGLTAGEYTAAVVEHGLVTGFGDTGSVGIGGITLGGGVGYLVRKHGLTDRRPARGRGRDRRRRATAGGCRPTTPTCSGPSGVVAATLALSRRFQLRLHDLAVVHRRDAGPARHRASDRRLHRRRRRPRPRRCRPSPTSCRARRCRSCP